jgi:hypothetical protein
MAADRLPTVRSLPSLIFLTLHVSDDIARGISSQEPGNSSPDVGYIERRATP